MKLTFVSILLFTCHCLDAQVNVLANKKSDSTSTGQIDLQIPSNQFVIVYPMMRSFNTKICALLDYGNKPKCGNKNSYVSYLNDKGKARKMIFNSEAALINYFVQNGFEFKDGENNSFIFQKK